MIWINKI